MVVMSNFEMCEYSQVNVEVCVWLVGSGKKEWLKC